MKATIHQKAGPCLAENLRRLALASGLLLAALLWLAGAAPAQEVAQAQDDVEKRIPGLDPWNVEIRGGPKWDPSNAPAQLKARGKRHIEFIQAGVPVEYRSQRNPYPNVTKAIDAGREVYEANCKACHGPRGRGDGDAGLDLIPSPALLTELSKNQGAAELLPELLTELIEEVLEGRALGEIEGHAGRAALGRLDLLGGGNVHHRRADLLGQVGEALRRLGGSGDAAPHQDGRRGQSGAPVSKGALEGPPKAMAPACGCNLRHAAFSLGVANRLGAEPCPRRLLQDGEKPLTLRLQAD